MSREPLLPGPGRAGRIAAWVGLGIIAAGQLATLVFRALDGARDGSPHVLKDLLLIAATLIGTVLFVVVLVWATCRKALVRSDAVRKRSSAWETIIERAPATRKALVALGARADEVHFRLFDYYLSLTANESGIDIWGGTDKPRRLLRIPVSDIRGIELGVMGRYLSLSVSLEIDINSPRRGPILLPIVAGSRHPGWVAPLNRPRAEAAMSELKAALWPQISDVASQPPP